MAAKAKLLLRELKTIKADLAFVKQRCTQLEDENKVLRENREKGARHEDDDLVRLMCANDQPIQLKLAFYLSNEIEHGTEFAKALMEKKVSEYVEPKQIICINDYKFCPLNFNIR